MFPGYAETETGRPSRSQRRPKLICGRPRLRSRLQPKRASGQWLPSCQVEDRSRRTRSSCAIHRRARRPWMPSCRSSSQSIAAQRSSGATSSAMANSSGRVAFRHHRLVASLEFGLRMRPATMARTRSRSGHRSRATRRGRPMAFMAVCTACTAPWWRDRTGSPSTSPASACRFPASAPRSRGSRAAAGARDWRGSASAPGCRGRGSSVGGGRKCMSFRSGVS